jgi:iron complex outermembrane receptor protein
LQSETHLVRNKLDLVLAGRVDKHSELEDPIFSPRAALVFKPAESQHFRLTFNRAYNTPATQDFFLDILGDPNVFGLPPEYAVALRASGVPKSGLNFSRDENGRPFMYSSFSPDRNAAIPVDGAATLWPVVVGLLAAQGIDISGIPAPTPAQVRPIMAMLNPETQSFDLVSGPKDVPAVKPTITQTVEVGYKGVLADRLQLSLDIYRTRVKDFGGALHIITPNVFLNPGDVADYLAPFVGPDQAGQLAQAISQIPLGTVTPKEAVDATALILAPRNYGKVDVMGLDFGVDYKVNDQISFAGTYSFVDKNFFDKLDGVADFSLNAPRHKGSLAAKYRNSQLGLNTELRFRRTEGFRMISGVFVGRVEPYSLVDAMVGYAIPSFDGVTITLSATNLLDNKHREFIGAPEIGRLVTGRLSYSF